MGRRPRPVYFLSVQLRNVSSKQPTSTEPSSISLSIAGLRQKDTLGTVKDLLEHKYAIPRSHQTLTGPLPDTEELPDDISLRRLRILLSRVPLHAAEEGQLPRDGREDFLDSPSRAGILFSTAEVREGLLYQEGVGGRYQRRQSCYSCILWTIGTFVLVAFLVGVAYCLWEVPSYRLPKQEPWIEGVEERVRDMLLESRLEAVGIYMEDYIKPADGGQMQLGGPPKC
ncbi:hypothetical protein CYMTET_22753 [Cymbomonas tetramitiformis]|uniref:Uncharacterized protein n=1 Tax=Cymbomonas tetramitiformis TaxID=36881 RepID=A0AAE0G0R1_9CHLO|nr:hypothetical protein CYMTET_22753 [Cymbomonas tetramitiformis]